MLKMAGDGQYGIKGAEVIAIGAAQGFSWTVTIDVGARDGITRDMTVLNGDGLVGRITTVGPDTSTVLLANDPDFTVGTRMESSDAGCTLARPSPWLQSWVRLQFSPDPFHRSSSELFTSPQTNPVALSANGARLFVSPHDLRKPFHRRYHEPYGLTTGWGTSPSLLCPPPRDPRRRFERDGEQQDADRHPVRC